MPPDLFPAFLMSVLAAWLGLSLLARAPRDRAAQAFAWLCLHLTIYALAIVISRISTMPDVRAAMHRVEIAETVVLPPVWLLFIHTVVETTRLRSLRRGAIVVFSIMGVALAAFALFSSQVDAASPSPRFPTPELIVASLLQRVLPLALSLWLVFESFRLAEGDGVERRRRGVFALAVLVAVSGAFLASAAREFAWSQAPGHVLMDAGLAFMAYMVLARRMLLPARVARRVFVRSLLGSGLTVLLILGVLLLEPFIGRVLGVSTPLLTIFVLVALVAIFGPVRDAAGAWLDQRFFHREFDYGQLLRAVSDDLFERGDLAGQLEAGLGAICRTLETQSGVVAVYTGAALQTLATYGQSAPNADALANLELPDEPEAFYGDLRAWPEARLLLPLWRGEQALGLLALGPKRSGDGYGEVERVLLDSLGHYLALAIAHARAQQAEELTMAALAEQSSQLKAEQVQLELQTAEARRLLAEARQAPAPPALPAEPSQTGLRVAALGPLHVERNGARIERWGGDKAGNYQSEALFAFLFDRRGKGLTKDEAEEVIWPDLELEKADMAFHRTLSALRRTLEPGLRRGNESKVVAYHHERYWLDPAAVAWCDADEYQALVTKAQTQGRHGDHETALVHYTQAVGLYRGDYMDDCPFFGDSSQVEQRREELRAQHVAALLGLGALYEQLGMVGEATNAYRRALAASQDDCPKAEDAIERLSG